ncbi:MAG: hypothetical protein IKN50_00895 [Clostridia bacterium]|nr:hypothetical protein [Clostridia bacterium]MBR3639143.1 hypothetical protein [Clostridia bacterium]
MDETKGDLGGMLEKLMSDPQVTELVKKLKESDAAHGADGEKKDAETAPDPGGDPADAGSILDSLGPLLKTAGRASAGTDNRNRLLAALKPYVNSERRDMIDKVTSISKLTSLLDAAAGNR